MKVCVVGSGGREHALARTLGRSADVLVAPGGAGMVGRTPEGHDITVSGAAPEDLDADLFVIGPEVPLVSGLADRLRSKGNLVVGPGAEGAALEGSKAFMKQVLAEAGVPTARYGVFDGATAALEFLRSLPGPWVVKTDGLAAGKGVLVADTLAEAEADVLAKLSGKSFGQAGRTVVIEEGLSGPECSIQALCDGRRVVPLAPARDFKRVGDADVGPNTGGMGSYSPLLEVSDSLVDQLMDEAMEPLLAALLKRGIDYRGILYAGIMLTSDGPKVLEYNVRLGDPEAQVVLTRLADDPVELMTRTAQGALSSNPPTFYDDASVCVVQTAQGYPGSYQDGELIDGLGVDGQLGDPVPGVTIFHAGTELERDLAGGPRFRARGGRVLGITAVAPTLAEARERAYQAVAQVRWPCHYRNDIAEQAVITAGSSS